MNIKDELLQELTDCREDERNSQAQFFQVISTAGALLGVLFGVSFFNKDNPAMMNQCLFTSNNASFMPEFIAQYFTGARLIFILNNLVFITAFSYSIYLGLINTLRYHYVQSIEDRLFLDSYGSSGELSKTELAEKNTFLHWGNYSSPIITKNRHHITSIHTLLSYWSYSLTIIAATLFSIILTFIQYWRIEPTKWYDDIGFGIVMTILVGGILLFFHTAHRAKNMSEFALKTAYERIVNRIKPDPPDKKVRTENKEELERSVFLKRLEYLIYPRLSDIEKPLFIIFSFVCVSFVLGYSSQNSPSSLMIGYTGVLTQILRRSFTWITIRRIILSVFVFDFLCYQARFQINDIRGVLEDNALYPHKRLIRSKENKERAEIRLSLQVAIIRIVSALVIVLMWGKEIKGELICCEALLLYLTVIYEYFKICKHVFYSDLLSLLYSITSILFCFATFIPITYRLFYISCSFTSCILSLFLRFCRIPRFSLFSGISTVLTVLLFTAFYDARYNLRVYCLIVFLNLVFLSLQYILKNREIKINCAIPVLINVGFGYSLRFAIGAIATAPDIWKSNSIRAYCIKIGVLLSISLLGSLSCILVWANNVCKNRRKYYPKSYLEYLDEVIFHKSNDCETGNKPHPLREQGKITQIWNVFYFLATFCTLVIQHIIVYDKASALFSLFTMITLCVECTVCKNGGILSSSALLCIITILNAALFWNNAKSCIDYLSFFGLSILLCSIHIIYAILRYHPEFKKPPIKIILENGAKLLIGEYAYKILMKSESNQSES